jgi:hypothetical protein
LRGLAGDLAYPVAGDRGLPARAANRRCAPEANRRADATWAGVNTGNTWSRRLSIKLKGEILNGAETMTPTGPSAKGEYRRLASALSCATQFAWSISTT